MNTWTTGRSLKTTTFPRSKHSIAHLTCQKLMRVTRNMLREFGKSLGMKNLGDCHDLYLKIDVLLLSNVFEPFRTTCLEHYALDPAHFYNSPGLAWQACLKKTEVTLELLTDPDMLLMFE